MFYTEICLGACRQIAPFCRNLLGRLPANRPVLHKFAGGAVSGAGKSPLLQQIADVLASLAPPKAEVA